MAGKARKREFWAQKFWGAPSLGPAEAWEWGSTQAARNTRAQRALDTRRVLGAVYYKLHVSTVSPPEHVFSEPAGFAKPGGPAVGWP